MAVAPVRPGVSTTRTATSPACASRGSTWIGKSVPVVNEAKQARHTADRPDHAYELRCTVCGQLGTVRVSIDPVSESPTQCPKCLHLAHPGACVHDNSGFGSGRHA